MKQWIAALNGNTIIALQHCCGVNDAPVNCALDKRDNWVCPHCYATYGAATPIGATERQSVTTIYPVEEE